MNIVWWFTHIDLHCNGGSGLVEEVFVLVEVACPVVCGNIFVVVLVVAVVDDDDVVVVVEVEVAIDGTYTNSILTGPAYTTYPAGQHSTRNAYGIDADTWVLACDVLAD